MSDASRTLAEFAVGLTWERIPPEVIERAKDCVIDTVAVCAYGSQLPWTQTVIEYARRNSAPGACSVFGTPFTMRAPFACLCNGSAAHAFELDSLVEPSVGVHPGASLAVPGLAPAQGRKLSGKALLCAYVAGFEVLYRIGYAANQSIEKVGFHSPGVVGVFGTAAVVGRLFGLDAGQLVNAFGIAGSLSSGLMEFSKTGGMTKRFHLGRAAEGGFLAALLARDGYTGPAGVLDGTYGVLNVFCRDAQPARLTQDLGSTWYVMRTRIKRYACHATAHVPVTLALDLKAQHKLAGDDVTEIAIAGSEKVVHQHAINEPLDLTTMQYSVPFCTAIALHRDPLDPQVFSEATLNDPKIRALAKTARVEVLKSASGYSSSACRLTLKLRSGRSLSAEGHDHKGAPTLPLTRDELLQRFLKLTAHRDRAKAERLFSQLAEAEKIADFGALDFAL